MQAEVEYVKSLSRDPLRRGGRQGHYGGRVDERMGFDAVFLGTGAGLPSFMGIPGENCNGVYSANEFLTRSNLMKAYLFLSTTPQSSGAKGWRWSGGNVAMDAVRTARGGSRVGRHRIAGRDPRCLHGTKR